jgi:multicomponent Na+:H+ antiporter subunit A
VALVALIFLLPWLGAALLPCLRPLLGRHVGRWALGPPAASFLITLTFVTSTSHDQGLRYTVPWFPMLGVNFSLWIDGLSVFFALLIAGMGLLITWYSQYYLDPSERQGRFYAYLLCFMGAMLGLVLSANLLTLFVFWELTSISSFLLIGFWQTRPESLYGARQALLVTVFGGLALLGGLIIVSHGTNLLLLTTGKLKRGAVPILVEGYQGPYVDPLPQALILTAIVISFAVTAFMLTLVYRTYQSLGTDDLDRLRRPPG